LLVRNSEVIWMQCFAVGFWQ